MSELVKQEELQRYGFSTEELQAAFKAQLFKDFESCNAGQYLQAIVDFSYETVHENLRNALRQIMDSRHEAYLQLLYRIDISEKQVADKMKSEKNRDSLDLLAELIIKRILQKVIYKKIYSK